MEIVLLVIYLWVARVCWDRMPINLAAPMKLFLVSIWPITFVWFWGAALFSIIKRD